MIKAINEVKAFATEQRYNIEGIGIGTPGIVDETNRIVLGGAENIKGWEKLHLADIIEKATGLPTLLGNDANLMGLGETMYGAGQGATHVVFLTVGTGIGGAVVIDGKLFNGFANRGTELGHVPLIANGEACACGSVAVWNITLPHRHWYAVSHNAVQKQAYNIRERRSMVSLLSTSTKREINLLRNV